MNLTFPMIFSIVVVLLVVYFQFIKFLQNRKRIDLFSKIFSGQDYDSIIITQGQNGPQSVDLSLSNFVYDVTMSFSGQTAQGDLLLPSYSCN